MLPNFLSCYCWGGGGGGGVAVVCAVVVGGGCSCGGGLSRYYQPYSPEHKQHRGISTTH